MTDGGEYVLSNAEVRLMGSRAWMPVIAHMSAQRLRLLTDPPHADRNTQ